MAVHLRPDPEMGSNAVGLATPAEPMSAVSKNYYQPLPSWLPASAPLSSAPLNVFLSTDFRGVRTGVLVDRGCQILSPSGELVVSAITQLIPTLIREW